MAYIFEKESSFIQACVKGDVKTTQEFLSQDKTLVHKPATNGSLPLMFAAEAGQVEICTLLLKEGARIDAEKSEEPNKGATALWFAACANKYDAVKMLFKAGAKNLEAAPTHSPPPIYMAAMFKQWDVVQMLLKAGVKNFDSTLMGWGRKVLPIIWYAIFSQEWDLAKMLFDAGAKNLDDAPADGLYRGIIATRIAFHYNHMPTYRQLLEKGASLYSSNQSTMAHFQALAAQTQQGNGDKSIYLMSQAAISLFTVAKKQMDFTFLKGILDILGTSLNGRIEGDTALHVALQQENLPVVEQLVLAGADLSLADKNGKIPEVHFNLPIIQAFSKLKLLTNTIKSQPSFDDAAKKGKEKKEKDESDSKSEKENTEHCRLWVSELQKLTDEILHHCKKLNTNIADVLSKRVLEELENALGKVHKDYIEPLRRSIVTVCHSLLQSKASAGYAHRILYDHAKPVPMEEDGSLDAETEPSKGSKEEQQLSLNFEHAMLAGEFMEPQPLARLCASALFEGIDTEKMGVRDGDRYNMVMLKTFKYFKGEFEKLKPKPSLVNLVGETHPADTSVEALAECDGRKAKRQKID